MYYTIYKITNLIDNKIYIGKHQTKDINDSYMGSGKYLKYAINKHGKENFKKEILFNFSTEDEMNDKEAELVTEEFCSQESTYNICVGGRGGFSYINKNTTSEERSKRVPRDICAAAAIRGQEKMKSMMIEDKVMKEKWKIKLSISLKEYHKTHENPFLNKNHTDETRKKMKESQSKIDRTGPNNPNYKNKAKLSKKIPENDP